MRRKKCYILLVLVVLMFSDWNWAGVRLDFDGDGKTDPTVFFAGNQMIWYTLKSTGGVSITPWGTADPNDNIMDWSAVADYDGDGKADLAIWREPNPIPTPEFGEQAYFYILYSSTNTYAVIPWGRSRNNNFGDFPVRGDYDGDGKTDVAITRQTLGGINKMYYYILQSRDGFRIKQFGGSGDSSVPGDYDGDKITDFAVARRSNNTYIYYIERSSDGNWQVQSFGWAPADYVLPGADFDGDGKTDIAVWGGNSQFGGGVWSWIRSSDGATESVRWGFNELTDGTAIGDYDGDGKTDIAVKRRNVLGDCSQPSYFWILGSQMGTQVIQWGTCHGHPSYND